MRRCAPRHSSMAFYTGAIAKPRVRKRLVECLATGLVKVPVSFPYCYEDFGQFVSEFKFKLSSKSVLFGRGVRPKRA